VTINRREFIKRFPAALGSLAMAGRARAAGPAAGRVIVIGGGYGGATAAKYVKLLGPEIDVRLIERDSDFVSCPFSNLVLSGLTSIEQLTFSYKGLERHGVGVLHDEALEVDPVLRKVRLASGGTLEYDRLIVAPGVDFEYDALPGLQDARARKSVLHAWSAGPQTTALRRQLESMRDGGVFVIHIPPAPYRCAPAPYERACQVAYYFSKSKPRSKVLVLDANEEVQSKRALFSSAWNGPYKGIVEYRPNSELVDVDAKTLTAKLVFEDVKADVLNVLPPQKAGAIARKLGLVTANGRWCGVNWLSMESEVQKGVHVLGDATLAASQMPKSATMANQHAKVCAAAVVALMRDRPVDPEPTMANACYSFIDGTQAGHVATRHVYDAVSRTMAVVPGSASLSLRASETEGAEARQWAKSIWADTFE